MGISIGILIGVLISVAVFEFIKRRIWFESSRRAADGLSYAEYENEAISEDDIDNKAKEDYQTLIEQHHKSTQLIQTTGEPFKFEEKQRGRYKKSDRDTYISIDEAD
ncbi:uncharacterized protein LOC134248194 [Saccostrea cucullata]|uniref:uncharacterized protein LOC134248194 n=1 Tax=Saccostrea cuccullata TaxID=36930 RepID=UPI002ED3A9B8